MANVTTNGMTSKSGVPVKVTRVPASGHNVSKSADAPMQKVKNAPGPRSQTTGGS